METADPLIPALKGKRVILGVTGGIAAYKVCGLASSLTKAGVLVDVVMTDAATRFVSPMTFQSLTGRAVYNSLWDGPAAGLSIHIPHVGLAHGADLAVIAPATANTLAKIARGIADNKLTTILLSARGPLLVAPAMDVGMWDNVATRENARILQERGVHFVGPDQGRMASGLSGKGRMSEAEEIFDHVRLLLTANGPLKGRKVVVSAGPTREFADPFRFISNPSSGLQGYALAQAALDLGAKVVLVSGPVELKVPHGAELRKFTTALELKDIMEAESVGADLVIMAAAVADFRPAEKSARKIKRNAEATAGEGMGETMHLVENPDILKSLGKMKAEMKLEPPSRSVSRNPTRLDASLPLLVGFAAESQDLEANASRKLKAKNLDWIAANPIGAEGTGFAGHQNRIVLLGRGGEKIDLGSAGKESLARALLNHVTAPLQQPGMAPSTGRHVPRLRLRYVR